MKLLDDSYRKVWLLIFLVPVCYLIPYIGQFIYQNGYQISDLIISHLPNAIFLKSTLLSGQGLPFWSPTILSGYPFYADPLSGLWYPPGWLTMLFPWPVGFNVVFILHLIFGGLGLFFWLRKEGLKPASALIGGLLFESLPKLIAHFEAGHITLVSAVCWTPWLLLADKIWREDKPGLRSFIAHIWRAPGLVLGVIFLIDSRWSAYAGIIWLSYTLWTRLIVKTTPKPGEGSIKRAFTNRPGFTSWILFILPQMLLVLLISAPLSLPLLHYTFLSTRAALTPEEAFIFSLPPARLLGIIFPDLMGNAEWTFYPGCLGFILTGLILFSREWRSRAGLWLWILLISIIYALGSGIPGLSIITRLPGFDLLRVPPRAMFGAGLAFSIISAYAVDGLIQPNPKNSFSKRFSPNLFLSGVAFFVLLSAIGFGLIARSLAFNFAWGAASLILGVIWITLRLYDKVTPRIWAAGVVIICLLNTGVVEFRSITPQLPGKILAEGADVASYLTARSSELFRTYSPSYSLPQQTAALAGLQLVDGVDPLQLTIYDQFMTGAMGIPNQGYSVTLPPFPSDNTAMDNQSYSPDPLMLGLLNVKYIVSAFALKPDPNLVLDKQMGLTWIYENKLVRPRAWIQADAAATQISPQKVNILKISPNVINLEANGPGLLVLSEINYPGWRVWVDDRAVPIEPVYTILRGVDLPPGPHQVTFKFVPVDFYIGLGLFFLPIIAYLIGRIVHRHSN